MKYKVGQYYKCKKDLFFDKSLDFKKNKNYKLIKINEKQDIAVFINEYKCKHEVTKNKWLKYFINNREEKLKRILNEI